MYFVLAGGYWGVSGREFNRQVDPQADGRNKNVDYIIRIDGLPVEFFKPEDIQYHSTYFCKTCKRPIPEWEIERKEGCWSHEKERRDTEIRVYPSAAYEEYSIPKKSWLSPTFRVWMNNEQGLDKWRQVWRYVEHNYPPTKILPQPKAVGTLRSWTIESSEDVPMILLASAQEEEPKPLKRIITESKPITSVGFKCPECDKEFPKKTSLSLHLFNKHKKKLSEAQAEV